MTYPAVKEWFPKVPQISLGQQFFVFLITPSTCMSSLGVSSVQLAAEKDTSDWVLPSQEVTKILVEKFKEVPQVKSICAEFRADEIAIWTLLESYNREAREEIYKKELEISERFRLRDFDFRATSVDLISPNELVKAGAIEVFKRG